MHFLLREDHKKVDLREDHGKMNFMEKFRYRIKNKIISKINKRTQKYYK